MDICCPLTDSLINLPVHSKDFYFTISDFYQ